MKLGGGGGGAILPYFNSNLGITFYLIILCRCLRHLIHDWTAYSAAWATPARIEKYEKFVCDVYHGVYWKRCNVTNYMLPQNQGVICDRYRNKMKEELLAYEFNKFIDANY